ncbi:MAG: pyruvate, orthophosphate dikinase [Solirubrobacteraceae bacterium]|jgi:pyruvate,orthophosphate dikinase|nr:pyruvate, orthophosphate dikinase [Solirubrobacteraceae bacterium]
MSTTSVQTAVAAFDAAGEPDVNRLGGKGASLAKMVGLGMPVPPGFVLSTDIGRDYLSQGALPAGVMERVDEELARLAQQLARELGNPDRPLLVSVRSGAPVSMPGMMDTILNVGLNDEVVEGLARDSRDPEFAWSSYERLLDSFATTVRGISAGVAEEALLDAPTSGLEPWEASRERAKALLALIAAHDGGEFPQAPRAQVEACINAVFGSWNSPRAKAYRKFRGIDDAIGTACVVQSMVFGNRHGDQPSGSGVAFSRDPSTGSAEVYGEILYDAQGEDVVSGVRDAEPLDALTQRLPELARQLDGVLTTLEREARDLIEVEFTIELGKLWVLQTRVAQRGGRAAVRIAVDLVDEGLISEQEARGRISEEQLEAARAPRFADAAPEADVIARGLASSPGGAVGAAVFDAARAQAMAEAGTDVVLIRPTTSPTDVQGFISSVAVVTGKGGRTSHAAVVARGMGRPAVCGIGDVEVLDGGRAARIAGVEIAEGTEVAVDGDRGIVSRVAPPFADVAEDPYVTKLSAYGASS